MRIIGVFAQTFGILNIALLLASCSTTPIPESDRRLFSDAADNARNPFIPLVAIKGENPTTLDVFSTYSELGATASSLTDGLIDSNKIEIQGSVNTSEIGVYTINYLVIDSSGREGRAQRIVNVVDRIAPQIEVIRDPVVVFEKLGFGNPNTVGYSDGVPGENGVLALDNYDGDLSSAITVSNPVDSSTEGNYEIIYSVKDSSKNESRTTRLIQVRDRIPPSGMIGDPSQNVISGSGSVVTIEARFDDVSSIAPNPASFFSLSYSDPLNSCNLSVGSPQSPAPRVMIFPLTVSNCVRGIGGSSEWSIDLRVAAGLVFDGARIPSANPSIGIERLGIISVNSTPPVLSVGAPTCGGAGICTLANRDDSISYLLSYTSSRPATYQLTQQNLSSYVRLVNSDCTNPSACTPLPPAGAGGVSCDLNLEVVSGQPQQRRVVLSNCQGNNSFKLLVESGAVINNLNVPSEAVLNSTVITIDNLAPMALISGAPASPTNSAQANLTISGAGVISYLYKVGLRTTVNGDCANASGYISVSNLSPLNLTNLPEGEIRFCARGRDAAGNIQMPADATYVDWTTDYTAPVINNIYPTVDVCLCYPQAVLVGCTNTVPNYETDGISVGSGETLEIIRDPGANPTTFVDPLATGVNYRVAYRARDMAGNTSTTTRSVHVLGSENHPVWGPTDFDYGLATPADINSRLRASINSGQARKFLTCGNLDFESAPFVPLGISASGTNPFRGLLDGRGKKWQNLVINERQNHVGIFAETAGSGSVPVVIRDLKIENLMVTGVNQVGGLVGEAVSTRLERISVLGTSEISGESEVGGLVGALRGSGSIIDQSFSSATVSAVAQSPGTKIGGLVGITTRRIRDSFVIPQNPNVINIRGLDRVGGLVGELDRQGSSESEISNSYAIAREICNLDVLPGAHLGGLVGLADQNSTIISSYWNEDIAISNAGTSLCDRGSDYGTPLTDAQMKMPISYVGWLATVWRLADDYYPDLLWYPLR